MSYGKAGTTLVTALAAATFVGLSAPHTLTAQQAMSMSTADTLSLSAKNESGITGSVIVQHKADSLQVTVMLHGVKEGQSYPTHIHQGTCAKPAAVVAALNSPKAGADGSASSTSMVPDSKLTDAMKNGSLVVQSHLPNGTPAACVALATSGHGM